MAQLLPLILLVSLLTVALLISEAVSTTNFTIVNQCDYTVWPGIASNSGEFPTTGFALEKGESRTLTAPTSWNGSFWGRTLCTGNSTGNFSCLTGDCGSGKLECSGNIPTQPTSLAEFSLDQFNGLDLYDVSYIHGFNLPMLVVPWGRAGANCSIAGCLVDINSACPPEINVKSPDGSQVIACKSACQAFGEPEYCCTGAYSTLETCKLSSYSQLYKSVCPTVYMYAFEEQNDFACASSADYTITFCPSTNTTSQGNILPGMSISGNQTLTSSTGTFALGFFSPLNSTKYFLGIWYNTIPNKPIVWVANRYSPLDSPGVFMIGSDGNLVVLDVTGEVLVWSSNASLSDAPKNATTGLLNDNGNLVLRFSYWSKLDLRFVEDTLWQSFDHPFDTLLPGMKLSLDKRTGQQRCLTSWAALDDPQPGNFSLGIDPKAHGQAFIWKENAPYWRSDLYIGKDNNTIVDDDWENAPFANGTSYFLTYNFDADEEYLGYEVTDSSVKLRAILNPTGQVELLLWQDSSKTWFVLWRKPVDKCDFYARCGPYAVCLKNETLASPCRCLTGFRAKFKEQWDMGNWSGGCVREKALNCDIGSEENFSMFERLKLPDHSILLDNKDISECETECRQNCSCTAYSYVNATELGSSTGRCLTWFGELIDLVENHTHGQNIYIRVPDQGGKGHSNSFLKKTRVITIISAAIGLLTIIFGYFIWKKTFGKGREHMRQYGEAIRNIRAGGGKNDAELPLFSLRCILAATDNFSEACKLGEGGFGPVYNVTHPHDIALNGILPENQEVAMKRLSKKSGQGHQEFMNELKLIAKLQHTNLVRLLGCCIEEEEMILIYEYMPNRSLDKFLFDPFENTKLDWDKRFRIIEGIAQGLLYIHKYSRLKIIHRDLKASNILLDGTMNPKISDFGMAKIFEINQTEANTNRVVGTFGYMAPEYARYGHCSEKLDVFSFGVLLLEIVSGKKNAAFYRFENSPTVAGWAWKLWQEDRGREVIDVSVRETCRPNEALRCIHIGFLCVQETPADRPTMSSVIHMLQSKETTSLPPSKEPSYSTHRNSSGVGSSEAPTSYSDNIITMSTPAGR